MNATWADCGASSAEYAPVGWCPVAGVEPYITWLASIGFGIVLAAVVVLIAWLKDREHKKRAPRLVSSLFSDTGSQSDDDDKHGRRYQELN